MTKNRLNFKSLLATISLGCMSMLAMSQLTTTLPVIDGNGSDAIWASAPTFTLDSLTPGGSISGPADCSGNFKVLWSTDSLYLLINVADDSLYEGIAMNTDTAWMNDNVVVYIDALNLKTNLSNSFTDKSQAFYEIYWDELSTIKGRQGPGWAAPTGINHANVITDHVGYVTEVAIAWSALGLNAFAGSIVGLDVKIGDNDNDGLGKSYLAWNQTTGDGWGNASIYGQIYLNRDGTVKGLYKDNAPIVIDGKADEYAWANAEAWNITKKVAGGVNKITSTTDYSGMVKFLWTADSIYAFYTIKDDILYSGDAFAYANDNATIAMDLFNKKSATYIDSTQFYWEIYWYNLIESGRLGPNRTIRYPIHYQKIVDVGTGYTLEAAIPFANAGYVPANGKIIGIDVKLNENDGQGRDQLAYHDLSDNMWQYPNVFGVAKLTDNGKVLAIPIPATPGLVATADSNNAVLTWAASADAAKYVVYKTGVSVDTLTALTYTDHGLADGTYSYSLRAISADGVVSGLSTKSVVINTVPPTVVITTANDSVWGPFVVTITFSKKVTGFTASDIQVTGADFSGTLGSSNDIVFKDTLDPVTVGGGSHDVTISIAAGVCTDLNTAPNSAATPVTVKYIELTGVEYTPVSSISVYPNPVDGVLNYSITGYSGASEFSIYNLVGGMIYQNTFTNSNGTINMSAISSGAYILKVNSGGNVHIQKLIVK